MRRVSFETRIVVVFAVLVGSAALRDRLGHLATDFCRQSEAGFVTDSRGAAPAESMPVVQLALGSVQATAVTSRRNQFSPQELADAAVAVRSPAIIVSVLLSTQTNRLVISFPILSTLPRAPPC